MRTQAVLSAEVGGSGSEGRRPHGERCTRREMPASSEFRRRYTRRFEARRVRRSWDQIASHLREDQPGRSWHRHKRRAVHPIARRNLHQISIGGIVSAGRLVVVDGPTSAMISRVAVIGVFVVMVATMNLMNQSKSLQMNVGRCRQPKGYQQQRHEHPNTMHKMRVEPNGPRIKGGHTVQSRPLSRPRPAQHPVGIRRRGHCHGGAFS